LNPFSGKSNLIFNPNKLVLDLSILLNSPRIATFFDGTKFGLKHCPERIGRGRIFGEGRAKGGWHWISKEGFYWVGKTSNCRERT